VEFKQADGSLSKSLLIKIPYRSRGPFLKVQENLVSHLEQKFNWPVIVIATRTIQSKRGIHFLESLNLSYYVAVRHRTQKRPRSRTLTTVHREVLEDIVIYIL
jgi:hypothetical protein